jgi:ribosomal protein S12 methylthiotransferase
MSSKKQIINIITLGCSKNTVDSEHLAGRLDPGRFEIRHESIQDSDIVIVNTCGFIGDAKEESIDTILSFAKARKHGKLKKLIVMGCLVERYKRQLVNEIHEVDAFVGVNNLNSVVEVLQGFKGDHDYPDIYNYKRTRATADHYAYLKISEGCDRKCSFCAIPLIRGKHKSIAIEELINESAYLASLGVKELILIAQDLTYYGIDLYGQREIVSLIQGLSEIDGIEWIRLQYMYPHNFPMELAHLIANNKKVCNYLDLPLQHISERILRSMKRGMGKAETLDLIEAIRRINPGVAFRTTFIVGYPGETEAEFNELYNFVKTQRFERVGVFTYSAEEDTSAFKLRDDVPEQKKRERMEVIMELQQQISLEHNIARIGSIDRVLIDRAEGGYYVGRTQYDSPEVDNEVLIDQTKANLEVGNFYELKFTSADFFDLHALPA